ncbi:MAG: hypothetical protein AB7S49_08450 [Arcobacter sp.]|jgi:hypothetical protein|uniref:DUF4381 domain-containing protein n=1 Tax=Arcobacter defluvii TaxID=873191 RepID=A0AAE7BFC6_9BACT|nr:MULTISPECIES: hypothetical protein [Arcobacter]MDY3199612.1 hypothetical protein [Arcobacter sp.]QKF76719.1 hypothetical protein ADFLV_0670 [Arcobacter defluvii]RXI34863.1 hypothetical protein CP964_01835 [Arcobacter defluvii]BAK72531.1 conserved hypothetical protein [Arcobacter sp. L]
MNEDILSKLNDIKELEKIPDNSIFIFALLVFLGILVLLSIVFLIIKFLKNRKKSPRKIYFEILKQIDFEDAKKSAYLITKYARLVASNEREKKLANELIDELEKYKYRKNVEIINNEIKNKYSIFLEALDV